MAQTRHITVFDGLTHTMQGFLHFLGVASEAPAASGSATAKTGTETHMPKPDQEISQEADRALGSVLFAIGAYGRYSLMAVAEKLLNSQTATPEKSLVAYSDSELRKELSKRAKRLRKENPVELIQLHHYLIAFSQNR